MPTYVPFNCDFCKKDFQKEKRQCYKQTKHNFCSSECSQQFQNKSVEVSCLWCGKTFPKTPAQLKKHPNSFCDHTCSANYQNQQRKENGYSTKGKIKITQCSECNIHIEITAHMNANIKVVCVKCYNKLVANKSKKNPDEIKGFTLNKYNCDYCKYDFYNDRPRDFCTSECRKTYLTDNQIMSKAATKKILEGKASTGGGIKSKFISNNKEINCDSLLEYCSLEYFTSNYNVIEVSRCNFSIPYIFEDKNYLYIPDFIIKTSTEIFIVECKSFVGDALNIKWRNYKEKAVIKEGKLKEYALENGYTPVWFSPHNPIFRKVYSKFTAERRKRMLSFK